MWWEKNDFKLVSKDWIIILKKENKISYISGYKFPLNNQAVGKICDDKYALYDTLKQFFIPIAEHYIVFKNYDKNKIMSYAAKYNFDIVIKNDTGTCGNDMFRIKSKKDLFCKIDKLLSKNYSISLSPYYDIHCEYRAIILKDNIELIYGKRKPVVFGDGKSTIYELLCRFNKNYFEKASSEKKLDKVLECNEKYEYNWQFNLSKGAMPFLIEDEIKKNNIENMAKFVANILGVSFASIDII